MYTLRKICKTRTQSYINLKTFSVFYFYFFFLQVFYYFELSIKLMDNVKLWAASAFSVILQIYLQLIVSQFTVTATYNILVILVILYKKLPKMHYMTSEQKT